MSTPSHLCRSRTHRRLGHPRARCDVARIVRQRRDRHVQPGGRFASVTPTVERDIEVKGVDAEALLVNWLNELIYHTEMDGEVFCEFHVESLRPDTPPCDSSGG